MRKPAPPVQVPPSPSPPSLSVRLPLSPELVDAGQRLFAAAQQLQEAIDAFRALRASPEGQALGELVDAVRRRR